MSLINKFVRIENRLIDKNSIVVTEKTREWCGLPYPGHRNGCPNQGKYCCPPSVPYIGEEILSYKIFMLIFAEIDFKSYKEEMGKQHPNFTEKQKSCCLYWQSTIKNLLKNEIRKETITGDLILFCGSGEGGWRSMESAGINVIQTLRNNNIPIETKPIDKIFMVTLICRR